MTIENNIHICPICKRNRKEVVKNTTKDGLLMQVFLAKGKITCVECGPNVMRRKDEKKSISSNDNKEAIIAPLFKTKREDLAKLEKAIENLTLQERSIKESFKKEMKKEVIREIKEMSFFDRFLLCFSPFQRWN